jgi:hypothetical protein
MVGANQLVFLVAVRFMEEFPIFSLTLFRTICNFTTSGTSEWGRMLSANAYVLVADTCLPI